MRIGISGYPPWRGVFYPQGLRQDDELSYASRTFRSIEINGTFYSMQRPEYFAEWAKRTHGDFVFSVKAPRYITHILRLKEAETPLANFFASGLLELGPKLGPVLWQLPPSFKFDPERLDAFLGLLPRDTDGARALARRHNDKVKGRSSIPEQPGSRSATRWKSATKASETPPSSACCAATAWRSSAPTRSNGRV